MDKKIKDLANQNTSIRYLIITAICIACGIALPQAFHVIAFESAGKVFLPMHIPILICGFLCGWKYGLLCGLITPFLSSFTGMPQLFPTAVWMMFELAAYGCISGLLYKKYNAFISLIGAMFCGRVVLAITQFIIFSMIGQSFDLRVFLVSTFGTAIPGIFLQIIVIPALIKVLHKVGYI